jgi:hypothetical protein
MQEAVRAVGQRLHVVTASVEAELEPAFATIERRAGALMVPADPFFNAIVSLRWRLATRCLRATHFASTPWPAAADGASLACKLSKYSL